jgi:hypothetical protein
MAVIIAMVKAGAGHRKHKQKPGVKPGSEGSARGEIETDHFNVLR